MIKPVPLGPVPEEALAYLRAKGLKPGFSYLDVWREEHAFAFTVAKLMELDLLDDVRAAVTKALAEGQTLKEWTAEVMPTLERSGWIESVAERDLPRRLATIYQTNMRVARAAGQWDRIQRTKRALPYLLYQLGPSERHREQHAAWAGLILPADHPFWVSHFPPNGWGCKCHVRQLSRREAADLGGEGVPPEVEYTTWTNPRTGTEVPVPVGIDPGWDYNPGLARADCLSAALQERVR